MTTTSKFYRKSGITNISILKINQFQGVAHEIKPDLINLTETWCNPSITNTLFNIPGYFIDPALRIYRSDTNCGRGGGIFILCKKWTYYFISCMTRQSADIFNLKPKNSKLELRRNCFRDRVETIGINYHKISNLLYSKTSMITTLDPQ